MIRHSSKMLLVMLLLVTQVGQTFAFAIPCDGHDKMTMDHSMLSDTTTSIVDHSHHVMMMEASEATAESSQDCCQKDCCCPVALMSVAALIDSEIDPSLNIHSVKTFDANGSMVNVFIALLQRPPNTLNFFTI
ncbi:hypothetical protein [Aliiglaciecola litoralis]|uniref:DUF2946 domain-containing protein n=1 Tax=Aliiglaciecola litoralis TaxID=582857 RepID=A0ABN1LBX7_9ALTE